MIKLLIVLPLLAISPVSAKDVGYRERYLVCKEVNEIIQENYEAGYINKHEMKRLMRNCALLAP